MTIEKLFYYFCLIIIICSVSEKCITDFTIHQNSYLRHEHNQATFTIIIFLLLLLDSLLHRRKCLTSECIKIMYIQMKRGVVSVALLFHQSRCWSVCLCLHHGSKLCKERESEIEKGQSET